MKVTSWLNNVWNLHEAQQSGYDEVVLLNERGEVAECTAANIFCVTRGRVLTPPLSSGCLEGVTRGVVLEIGAGAGVQVDERTLRPEDLYSADGVFISSTNRNMIAVSEINGHKIATAALPVMQKLEKAFTAYVREYVASAWHTQRGARLADGRCYERSATNSSFRVLVASMLLRFTGCGFRCSGTRIRGH